MKTEDTLTAARVEQIMTVKDLILQLKINKRAINTLLPEIITLLAHGNDDDWETFWRSISEGNLTQLIVEALPVAFSQLSLAIKENFHAALSRQLLKHPSSQVLIQIRNIISVKPPEVESEPIRDEPVKGEPAEEMALPAELASGPPPVSIASPVPAPTSAPVERKAKAEKKRIEPKPALPEKSRARSMAKEEFAELRESVADQVESVMESEADGGITDRAIDTGKRRVLVDYFNQMNAIKVYPLNLVLSKHELVKERGKRDILTGESRTQVVDEFELATDKPLAVKVHFPGCLVTPDQLTANPNIDEQTLTFHVMPMAKGKLQGTIRISQEMRELVSIQLDYKVVDQRLAKMLSLAGIVIGLVPPALTLFGVDLNQQLSEQLFAALPTLGSPVLLLLELVSGSTLLGLAGVSYFLYRGKRSSLLRSELSLP